ncbi:MAG: hypothetical protein ACD_46C00419G0002 [uncultured bacterium]|nr:MAG: hypothetical protein ACD_46C00419G0002 [uncultured bacterium]
MEDKDEKFNDITLICKDCGKEFTFSANDQKFYAKQGFVNAPARCRSCREEFQAKKYKGLDMHNVKCKICDKVGKLAVQPTYPKEVMCGDCFAIELEKEKQKNGSLPFTLKEAVDRIGGKVMP